MNRPGAIAGMLVGALGFIFLHTGMVANVFNLSETAWLTVQSSNAFTCSGLGVIASVTATVIVTLFTSRDSAQIS